MAAQVAGVILVALADHLLVAAVDVDARQVVARQRCTPHPALAPDHAIGYHVGVLAQFADLCAGLGVQRTQQLHYGFNVLQGLLQLGRQTGDADLRQALKCRTVDDLQSQQFAWRVIAQYRQLQGQAFTQVACGHAHRVEALQLVQDDGDFIFFGHDLRQQGFDDAGEWFAQVAIGVQGIDQRGTNAAITRRQVRKMQLPEQVVLQGIDFGHAFGSRALVVIVIERTATSVAATVHGPGDFIRRVLIAFDAVVVAALFVRRAVGGVGGFGTLIRRFGPVQQRVGFHRLGDFQFQLGSGHLQQADGLTQLWRHDQLLTQRCLQAWFHSAIRSRCGTAPGRALRIRDGKFPQGTRDARPDWTAARPAPPAPTRCLR